MIISSKKLDPLEPLLRYDRAIELTYIRIKETKELLDSLDITLSTVPHYDKSQKTVTIYPIASYRQLEFRHTPNILDEEVPSNNKQVVIPDFDGSNIFYNKIKSKNSPLKIVADKYSIKRAKTLYEYVGDIELSLRNVLRKGLSGAATLEVPPKNYRRSTPDDKISQLNLTEVVFNYLLKDSGDDFYLDRLYVAKSDKEKVLARSSTVMNEIELEIDPQDLRKFINIRNSIMHFKTISFSDAEVVIRVHEKLLHYKFIKLARSYIGRKP